MGKALKFGDRYELRYPAKASDENRTGSHPKEIIGVGRSCESRRLLRSKLVLFLPHGQFPAKASTVLTFRTSTPVTHAKRQPKTLQSKRPKSNCRKMLVARRRRSS